MAEPVHLISLGAGVQSTVMALMADLGEMEPRPLAAIFADTGWEPRPVYQHLDWLETELTLPVHRVTVGRLQDNVRVGRDAGGTKPPSGFAQIPLHTRNARGEKGMGFRQCTTNYKVLPIRREARRMMLAAGAGTMVQWVGISVDEAHRMKPSGVRYAETRYPLIERGMSRQDCLEWWRERYPGRPLVKSACLGCPYQSDARWLENARADPEGMRETIEIDRDIREMGNQPGMRKYLHRSCEPLADVIARLERLDALGKQLSLWEDWGNECSGMCGV